MKVRLSSVPSASRLTPPHPPPTQVTRRTSWKCATFTTPNNAHKKTQRANRFNHSQSTLKDRQRDGETGRWRDNATIDNRQ